MKLLLPGSTLLLALASLWSAPSHAVDVTRKLLSHGPANCQSALPVFDGLIRKRPKAIANEGTGSAFITCDFESLPNSAGRVQLVYVYLTNRSAAPMTISCTLVQGFGDTVFKPSLVKSQVISAGAASEIGWFPSDFGNVLMDAPSLSCNLPAASEISGTELDFLENVGA